MRFWRGEGWDRSVGFGWDEVVEAMVTRGPKSVAVRRGDYGRGSGVVGVFGRT